MLTLILILNFVQCTQIQTYKIEINQVGLVSFCAKGGVRIIQNIVKKVPSHITFELKH